MLAFFTRAIHGAAAIASLPPALRQELSPEHQGLASPTIPESVQGNDRMLLERAVADAFVTSFRSVVGVSAGVALAAALASVLTVRGVATTKAREEPTLVCTHLDQVHQVTPSSPGCEECLRIGQHWVHLRLCLSCGHVGCCDSSKNRHATAHFWETSHPIVRSLEHGEDWRWCYVDEIVV